MSKMKFLKIFSLDNEKSIWSKISPFRKNGESKNKKGSSTEIAKIEGEDNESNEKNCDNHGTVKILKKDFNSVEDTGIDWAEAVSIVLSNLKISPRNNEDQTREKSQPGIENKPELEQVVLKERRFQLIDNSKKYGNYSETDSDDQEDISEIVARGPDRIRKNKGSQRTDPTKTEDQPNKFERFLEYSKISKEIDNLIAIEKNREKTNNSNATYVASCSNSNEELVARDTVTPESGYCSPGLQFNYGIVENEIIEHFLKDAENDVRHRRADIPRDLNLPSTSDCSSELTSPRLEDNFKLSERKLASKDHQINNLALRNTARNKLFNSEEFSQHQCFRECVKIYEQIAARNIGTNQKEIIHYMDRTKGKNKYRRMNLHDAVAEENLEKCFAIIEIHKRCHESIYFWINNADSDKKTVYDRAQEKDNSVKKELLIKYLEENHAEPSP